DLPLKKKVDLLADAARHKKPERRESALEQLADLNHKLFVQLFVELLDQLPESLAGRTWLSSDSRVGSLAMQTEDVRAWRALEKTLRRVEVNRRIVMLQIIAGYGDSELHPKRMPTFLAAFLDDSEKDSRGREFRNYAAMEIANLLKLDRKPQPTWG